MTRYFKLGIVHHAYITAPGFEEHGAGTPSKTADYS